ncbi:ATPase [Pikeienuella piscinae]|uniref:ATPase n=1 Tax=Pikeienuella piscinae TaxID=2748098 RepID=A0A7L5BSK8_9RHOB|nr:ATP12 family protein [Pikeienuella piscinae]QIE54430.1 ATPase [Pikeienuella piscinae]
MKRFYKTAEAVETPAGWTVTLDERPIRTPAKAVFVTPGRALAAAAAEEWAAQETQVKPAEMPITRAVNTAIDRTAPEHEAVVEIVAAYGGTDLVSYRANAPAALRARQEAAWDPLVSWVEAAHGARLVVTTGVMHALQPEEGQRRLKAAVAAHDAFRLTALYDLAALSGSLVIALAVAARRLEAEEGWRLSRVDESWQEEFWGVDAEAAAMAAKKKRDFKAAALFLDLLEKD